MYLYELLKKNACKERPKQVDFSIQKQCKKKRKKVKIK